eukprot:gene15084-20296_t
MVANLLEPEFLFNQLMEWLTLIDLSSLDCSLCCHSMRDIVLNRISLSTVYSPLIHNFDKEGQLHSYWMWLQTRKIYFKEICIQSIKEASLFINLYASCITKESQKKLANTMKEFTISLDDDIDINNNETYMLTLETLLIGFKLFSNLETFSCDCRFVSDNILVSILSCCTKLKSISLSNLSAVTDAGISAILKICQTTIESLYIIDCSGIDRMPILPILLPNLVELNYEGNNLENFRFISLGINGLLSLSLSGMEMTSTDDSIQETLKNLRNLTSFSIEDTPTFSGISLAHMLPASLTNIELRNCLNVSHKGLCNILSNNLSNLISLELFKLNPTIMMGGICSLPSLPSSLNSLYIAHIPSFLDKELNELCSDLPHLDTLVLTSLGMLTGKKLSFILPQNLRVLTIIDVKNFSDTGLKYFLSNKLRILSRISINCHLITGEGLAEVLPQSIFLLDLSGCYLSEKGLKNILSNDLLNLEYLDLSYCDIIINNNKESIRLLTSELSTLHINGNKKMTDNGLYHLFLHNNLTNLTRLDMSELYNINNLELKPSLPMSLINLNLSKMKNLTNFGLKQLFSNNLINLKVLDISFCHKINCDNLIQVLPNNLECLTLSKCKSLTCDGCYYIFKTNLTNLKKLVLK